jgi:hypothetical protein
VCEKIDGESRCPTRATHAPRDLGVYGSSNSLICLAKRSTMAQGRGGHPSRSTGKLNITQGTRNSHYARNSNLSLNEWHSLRRCGLLGTLLALLSSSPSAIAFNSYTRTNAHRYQVQLQHCPYPTGHFSQQTVGQVDLNNLVFENRVSSNRFSRLLTLEEAQSYRERQSGSEVYHAFRRGSEQNNSMKRKPEMGIVGTT